MSKNLVSILCNSFASASLVNSSNSSKLPTVREEKGWQLQRTGLLRQSHLQFVYSLFASLHPFTAKPQHSFHWFSVITLVASGPQSGRGVGLTRPAIRAQQKPASVYSTAPATGCCSLWSLWDFITERQMDEPGTAEFKERGRAGRGWRGRQLAYSVVACLKWRVSMQPGDTARGGTQQRKWHICLFLETTNSGNQEKCFSSMVTMVSEWVGGQNKTMTSCFVLFFFPQQQVIF